MKKILILFILASLLSACTQSETNNSDDAKAKYEQRKKAAQEQ